VGIGGDRGTYLDAKGDRRRPRTAGEMSSLMIHFTNHLKRNLLIQKASIYIATPNPCSHVV
jgi:hypothetical protein